MYAYNPTKKKVANPPTAALKEETPKERKIAIPIIIIITDVLDVSFIILLSKIVLVH